MEWFPPARASALCLELVTLEQMILALVQAVESPHEGVRVVEVPEIRDGQASPLREQAKTA